MCATTNGVCLRLSLVIAASISCASPVRAAPEPSSGLAAVSPAAAAQAQASSTATALRSFGSGALDVYLLGGALGLLDVAGLHKLDHPIHAQYSGVWSIAKSPRFPEELIGLTMAAAVWEGGRSTLGRTLWQSLDAAAMAGISTQALKWTFQRMRPSTTNNPDRWFQGVHNMSFPSGDVSSITAIVTPLILQYHRSDPQVDALAALPVFDMAARMKAHGHWFTDTVAGAVVGAASGYFAHRMRSPLVLGLLPGGFYVGLREQFR